MMPNNAYANSRRNAEDALRQSHESLVAAAEDAVRAYFCHVAQRHPLVELSNSERAMDARMGALFTVIFGTKLGDEVVDAQQRNESSELFVRYGQAMDRMAHWQAAEADAHKQALAWERAGNRFQRAMDDENDRQRRDAQAAAK